MTRPTNMATLWVIIVATSTMTCSTGCGINRRYANGQIHQLPHTNVLVEYAWGQSGSSEIQQSDSAAGHSGKQTLTIQYPHPSPRYGHKYAEVILRRESNATDAAVTNAISQLVTNPFKRQELMGSDAENGHVLRLTISREDLEFLLRDLVADSYFDREERTGDVNLFVTLGSRTTRKPWDHISSFDQLAEKVVEENSHRPAHPQSGKVTPASAELLPPMTNEPLEVAQPDQASGRLHRAPKF